MSTTDADKAQKTLFDLKRKVLAAYIDMNNINGEHTYISLYRLGDYHPDIDARFQLHPENAMLAGREQMPAYIPLTLKVGLNAALLDLTGEDHIVARMSFNGVSGVYFLPWGWLVSVRAENELWGYVNLPAIEQSAYALEEPEQPAAKDRPEGSHLKVVK